MGEQRPACLPDLREPFRWSHNPWRLRWEIVEGDVDYPDFPPMLRAWVHDEYLEDARADVRDAALATMTERYR